MNSELIKNRRSPVRLSRNQMEKKLSTDQLLSLRRLESFGWTLRFIRQPLFQDPVPVVIKGKGTTIGILDEDGRLNINVDIQIRQEP